MQFYFILCLYVVYIGFSCNCHELFVSISSILYCIFILYINIIVTNLALWLQDNNKLNLLKLLTSDKNYKLQTLVDDMICSDTKRNVYADDIILLTQSVTALQNLFRLCGAQLNHTNMSINSKKTRCPKNHHTATGKHVHYNLHAARHLT